MYRFARFSMVRALASSKMDTNTRVSCDTAFFTAKGLLNGLTALSIRASSVKMKSPERVTTLGLTAAPTKDKF
jgi:hypothetical protein